MKYYYTAVVVETRIVTQNECNDAFIQVHRLSNNQNLNSDTLEKTSVNHTLDNSGKLPLTICTLKHKDWDSLNIVSPMTHVIITSLSKSF